MNRPPGDRLLSRRSLLALMGLGLTAACTTTEHITITLDENRSAFGLRSSGAGRTTPDFTGPLDANRVSTLPSLVPGELPGRSNNSTPVSMSSDRLNLDKAEIVSVGVDDNGNFEVPDRLQIGWYRFGPSPGHTGSAVLAAHVALNGSEGLFRHLDQFVIGDVVDIAFEDDDSAQFEIQGVAQYNKDAMPLDDLFERTGSPRLILITCGGAFNPQLNSFDDNLIAFATPTAPATQTADG